MRFAALSSFLPPRTLTLINSLLAYNKLETGIFDTNDDCGGALGSLGGNLVTTVSTCSFSDPEGTSVTGLTPLLGTLSTTGSWVTPTYPLQANSIGIDLTMKHVCPGSYGDLDTDQRGFARIVDGTASGTAQCDAGAYEFNAPAPCPALGEAPTFFYPAVNEKSKKRMRLVFWNLPACATHFNLMVRQDTKTGQVVDHFDNMYGWSYVTKKLPSTTVTLCGSKLVTRMGAAPGKCIGRWHLQQRRVCLCFSHESLQRHHYRNMADADKDGSGDGGGIYSRSDTELNVSNSIVALNNDASPSVLPLTKPTVAPPT